LNSDSSYAHIPIEEALSEIVDSFSITDSEEPKVDFLPLKQHRVYLE
jgi:hypothetical protein